MHFQFGDNNFSITLTGPLFTLEHLFSVFPPMLLKQVKKGDYL